MKTPRFLLAASFSLVLASAAFSQEAIKFQIPTDSSGAIVPVVLPPTRPDTVQKLGLASNMPLNLVALSAKDTASFETYSRRISLVQDSISATYRAIDAVKKKTISFMPEFKPRDEYESTADYDSRKAKWDKELYERTERDTKSLTSRIAELERAKKKIEDNQVSLYGTINIISRPEAASIWIGREEIGATPAEYKFLIPGTVKISVRKEGYNSWDTTFQAGPGAKFRFNVILEEKSIFSTEKEIDFAKILSKDTTVDGYKSRIELVEARKAQVGEEIKHILQDFADKYPPLAPQKPNESPEAFKKRHAAWSKEGTRKVAEFQRKHEAYRQKLDRTVAVLNDYIISAQSTVLSDVSFMAQIELGAYDADKEQFELVVQDTENEKSPFYFKGKASIPRDTARVMNRSVAGFTVALQFINFPFKTDSASVNLAMSGLLLSRSGFDFKTKGSFSEIERYKLEEGYGAWKLRADSLLSGKLKSQGLDYAYAMGKAAAKDAVANEEKESGEGLGWRGWTRIIAFSAAVICGGAAVYKHLEAQKEIDNLNNLIRHQVNSQEWINSYYETANLINDAESHRNIFGAAAGVFAFGGAMTFFF